jgi:glutamate mutase epsilon subunit
MPKKPETIHTRVTRLEKAMAHLAEVQAQDHVHISKLDNAMAHLAEVQAQQQSDIREMKIEALEREKRLDERIGNLVSAIGELISQMRNGRAPNA